MKKIILFFSLLFLSLPETVLFAQRHIVYPIVFQSNRRCCHCDCDTTKVVYKPINHWNDVRHIIYTGFSPVNAMNIVLNPSIEGNGGLALATNTPHWQTIGYEYLWKNSFVGMDMGINFGSPSQSVSPQLNLRMTNTISLGLNVGHNLITTSKLRAYVMGKLQINIANAQLQRKLDDIPQKSWNRFIGSQNELLPYDRLVEGLLTTDRWGDKMNIHSTFFATQLRFGIDYRINKVKLGLHTGYSFQISEKNKHWRYTYEFEEGDETKSFKVTDVPIAVSLDGINIGFSIGYLISDVAK